MKVLIIGLGSIAKKHVLAIKQINPKIEIYALRSASNGRDESDVTNLFDILDAKNIDFDFVIISTPTYLHIKNIEQFSSFRKPLFIEKPLANTLEIKNLIPLIEENKIKTYVGCNLRFLECLQFVKDSYLNKEIRINEVNCYCGSFLPEWRKEQNYKNSYSSKSEKGGGVHLDLIHEIDYVYWLFGKPVHSHKIMKSNSSIDVDSIDYANYILDYETYCVSIILNYYRREAKRSLEIVAENCTININLLTNSVYENGNLVFSSTKKITDTYYSQMKWFLNKVKEEQKMTFNNIEEAFEVLKIALV